MGCLPRIYIRDDICDDHFIRRYQFRDRILCGSDSLGILGHEPLPIPYDVYDRLRKEEIINRHLEIEKDKKPEGQILLTSCDSTYFNRYAPALFQSAVVANTAVHFNIVNPSSEAAEMTLRMGNHPADAANKITYSFTYVDLYHFDARVYFSCDRFLLARDLIALDDSLSVLTIDVDSLIMKPFPDYTDEYDLGLWLRPNNPQIQEQSGLLAGMCLFSDYSLDFITEAAAKMEAAGFKRWFEDQHALWETYKLYDITTVEFIDFSTTKVMDWEFKDDTILWTGKGPRKHHNKKYVAKFDEFSKDFLRS